MSPDIRELFTDAADDSQRSQIDAAALLARGKRKVRLRRAGAAVGTGLLAAAAVAGITQLPGDQADGPIPPARTPTQAPVVPSVTTVSESSSASLPPPPVTTSSGTESAAQTSGAELIRKLPYAEAVRRCKARMEAEYGASGTPVPVVIGPGESQKNGLYVTDQLPMRMADGSTEYCSVPGAARPSYKSRPATIGDARDECGRLTWTNLTSWTVAEHRDPSGGLTATLSSTDRRAVLRCDIDPAGATRTKQTAFPDAYVFLVYGQQAGKPAGSAPNGVIGSAPDSTAVHAIGSSKDGRPYWGGGGIAKQGAVRYALFSGTTKLTEVPVRYGIYALRVWLPAGTPEPDRVVGYDSIGKTVESYQPA